MPRARQDRELRARDARVEALCLNGRKVLVVLAPEHERWTTNPRVELGQLGQRALITGAHFDYYVAHLGPREAPPQIGAELVRQAHVRREKRPLRAAEHRACEPPKEEAI